MGWKIKDSNLNSLPLLYHYTTIQCIVSTIQHAYLRMVYTRKERNFNVITPESTLFKEKGGGGGGKRVNKNLFNRRNIKIHSKTFLTSVLCWENGSANAFFFFFLMSWMEPASSSCKRDSSGPHYLLLDLLVLRVPFTIKSQTITYSPD